MKLWEGRFAAPTAADADAFNESLSFDKKLYKADITASLAHSEMLGRCGILSDEDRLAIQSGLKAILADIQAGTLEISGQEDIHSFVENELVSRIGDAGKRLHTARSRNDQVATDFRLYVRSSAEEVVGLLKSLISSLVALSENMSKHHARIHTPEKGTAHQLCPVLQRLFGDVPPGRAALCRRAQKRRRHAARQRRARGDKLPH